ncbi:MAG TPA: SOS response-associated peptidase [Xanthobacteraceae bacterium]|nr:SOS response-associated peptidase [Xanthobacteraceae bacterium]
MCGRYAITTAPEAILRWFKIVGTPPNLPPHYNAAPGQDLPVVRIHPETGERVLSDLRWGLIPYWSKDRKIGWKCINARGETARTAPAFRSAYNARRCLVPANAFYEWRANGKTKQPFAIAPRDRGLFAFAGLWENWKDPTSEEWVRTFTILTTTPNEVVALLHDRMPVIVGPGDYDRWLDTKFDPAALIQPYPAEEIVTWPVSTRINRPENDDAAVLDRVEATA